MHLASEAFRVFNEQSLEASQPAQLPDAVLQLLPKMLYKGEGSSHTRIRLDSLDQAPELLQPLPCVSGNT